MDLKFRRLDLSAFAFSLPPSSGSYEVLLLTNSNVAVKLLDITMVAADMGVTDIPVDHPDAENFSPPTFLSDDSFDLIMCDGQVLCTSHSPLHRPPLLMELIAFGVAALSEGILKDIELM